MRHDSNTHMYKLGRLNTVVDFNFGNGISVLLVYELTLKV